MLLRILTFVLILAGAVCTVVAAKKYYDLTRYSREEGYGDEGGSKRMQRLTLIALCVFIFGFAVGAADLLLREVDAIFLFVGAIFFLGGIYVLAMTNVQVSMTRSLRDKTIEIMRAFVNSIEMKDSYTQGHSWHVYHIVKLFYEHLPQIHKNNISELKLLDAALLHDIGKIGVPDGVLGKEGRLTPGEWDIIRMHPVLGHKMLVDTCFSEISEWVLYHHERMDGKGYIGLRGEEIPIESRIIAIADTYSAISTNRVYRGKAEHDTCLNIMYEAAGTQLDRDLLQYFLDIPKSALQHSLHEAERTQERAVSLSEYAGRAKE